MIAIVGEDLFQRSAQGFDRHAKEVRTGGDNLVTVIILAARAGRGRRTGRRWGLGRILSLSLDKTGYERRRGRGQGGQDKIAALHERPWVKTEQVAQG